jgi:hypothetical protein
VHCFSLNTASLQHVTTEQHTCTKILKRENTSLEEMPQTND